MLTWDSDKICDKSSLTIPKSRENVENVKIGSKDLGYEPQLGLSLYLYDG